jgi:thiamine-phosphate pyrophosphorylase
VYLVTDRRRLAPDARTSRDELTVLERFLDAAIDAAVDVIQVRERNLGARELAELVARVHARARATGTRVLVNDRADVAMAAGADGVHLPGDGLPAGRTRMLGPDWIIGWSVHPGDDLSDLADMDYLLFGTVFPTTSKPATWRLAGLDAFGAVAASAGTPVIAIGGVTPARASAVAAAGGAGVAAITLFLPPPAGLGPARATRALREAFGAPQSREVV